AGEGLFNESILKDSEGMVIEKDTACGDLPFIQHTKTLSTITPNGNNEYTITYDIVVENIGGAEGTYGLKDDPSFEDDITILDASYTTTSGVPTVALYPTDAVWTLASGVNLGAGVSHSYTVSVDVKIDLSAGSTGDNTYTACGSTATSKEFAAGEGLFNESILTDLNGLEIERDTACGDLPYITHAKTLSSITDLGDNTFSVLYEIEVKNLGGAVSSYTLEDAGSFEDDITIIDGGYSSPEIGAYAFTGNPFPLTITSGNTIAAGATETYQLQVKVAIDLTDGQVGDDVYTACGETSTTTEYYAGEGLFNESILKDSEGMVIEKDTACGDLPFIQHTKTLSTITPNGNNEYTITYDIVVENIGGAEGTYGLKDDPSFEDDITILDASYTTTSGVPTVALYPTDAVWTLASGVNLGAGASHSYTVSVDVKIDLSAGSTGDNTYTACGSTATSKEFAAGEGLFNESILTDLNGLEIERDTACGDLPYIVHTKVASNRTQIDRDEYTIEYTILVENKGGANGVYGLNDQPGFDDDIEIQSVSYTTDAGVTPNILSAGDAVWNLSQDVNLGIGQTHIYTLTVDILYNLEEGSSGDNVYTECSSQTGTDTFTKGEGLFNESVLLDLNEFEIDRDTACIDLLAALGDTVFVDINGNGIQDPTEPGLEGVEVKLNGTVNGNPITEQTAFTDVNGFYEFIGLEPGDYVVTFPTSADINGLSGTLTDDDATGGNTDGTDTNEDSDADQTTGETETYTLSYGEFEPRADAGYYVPASIGDTVFVDVNGNG
ncbi:SdrD B-like domain-containing protein, partial [Jiulongibacter sediminis]